MFEVEKSEMIIWLKENRIVSEDQVGCIKEMNLLVEALLNVYGMEIRSNPYYILANTIHLNDVDGFFSAEKAIAVYRAINSIVLKDTAINFVSILF